MTKIDVLQNCTVDGNIVRLPEGQLERKLYQEVAKALELIGGKWKGGKVMGFVFPSDPSRLLEQIANGENRNLKKEFQFFPTPDDIADYLVELADISREHFILEPSAGQGAIIHAIQRKLPNKQVHWFELMDVNRTFLHKIEGAICDGWDFIDIPCALRFDRIIANPPFSKNSDINHIRKMYDCLTDNGRLVSIASKHWQISSNKKETQFRQWLDEVNAEIYPIERGAFKSSGTMIESCIIVINKK